MKLFKIAVFAVMLLFVVTAAFSQMARQSQIEVYGGIAMPMAPEGFKDYYKVGLSFHGQYVMFPNPKLGISFGAGYEFFAVDNDAIEKDFTDIYRGYEDLQLEVEGSANILELSIGIRPYISDPEATNQIFLFGMGTYNMLKAKTKAKISYTGYDYDGYGNYYETTYTDESEAEGDDEKVGVAIGAGIEMPAGESMNLIFQGLYRFIFTEEENTTFLGITAGLIF